jgi:hypothetical protein
VLARPFRRILAAARREEKNKCGGSMPDTVGSQTVLALITEEYD